MQESSSASPATDLYDFGARSYDPSLGAFTSFDSVSGSAQNPLTLNRYLYANANPATLVDPTGHYSVDQSGQYKYLTDCPECFWSDWDSGRSAEVLQVKHKANRSAAAPEAGQGGTGGGDGATPPVTAPGCGDPSRDCGRTTGTTGSTGAGPDYRDVIDRCTRDLDCYDFLNMLFGGQANPKTLRAIQSALDVLRSKGKCAGPLSNLDFLVGGVCDLTGGLGNAWSSTLGDHVVNPIADASPVKFGFTAGGCLSATGPSGSAGALAGSISIGLCMTASTNGQLALSLTGQVQIGMGSAKLKGGFGLGASGVTSGSPDAYDIQGPFVGVGASFAGWSAEAQESGIKTGNPLLDAFLSGDHCGRPTVWAYVGRSTGSEVHADISWGSVLWSTKGPALCN